MLLSNGKAYTSGLAKQECTDECTSNDTCASFVWTAGNGYCELWSTTDSTTEWPGTDHCVVRKQTMPNDDYEDNDAAAEDGDDDYEYAPDPNAPVPPPTRTAAPTAAATPAPTPALSTAPTPAPAPASTVGQVEYTAELRVSPIDCTAENYQIVVDRATEKIIDDGIRMYRIDEVSAACADGGGTIIITVVVHDDEQLADRTGRIMKTNSAYIHTGAFEDRHRPSSSSTAAPATDGGSSGDGPMEQPEGSSSTAAPTVDGGADGPVEQPEETSSSSSTFAPETTTVDEWTTKGMEAEVGDDVLLEAPFISDGGATTSCSMSIYDVDDADTGWGGAFACEGEPLVSNFEVEASVGYTSQQCTVLTGLPEHDAALTNADQDLYMTVHGNCKSEPEDKQKWRVCSWRPDPSSFLCRTLGMPCCTYVSNMVGENNQESCEDVLPGQCKITYGFDGKSTKKYGLKLHGCSGDAPYNPMCSIGTGAQILGASAGSHRRASNSGWVIIAGVGMLVFAVALRARRRRRAVEAVLHAGASEEEVERLTASTSLIRMSRTALMQKSQSLSSYGSIHPGIASPTKDIENGRPLAAILTATV